MLEVRRSLAVVCQHYSVTAAELLAKGRPNRIVEPRSIVCWLAAELGATHQQISNRLGCIRRGAVYRCCTRVARWRESDPEFRAKSDSMLAELTGSPSIL